jgi:hypothetical protein
MVVPPRFHRRRTAAAGIATTTKQSMPEAESAIFTCDSRVEDRSGGCWGMDG